MKKIIMFSLSVLVCLFGIFSLTTHAEKRFAFRQTRTQLQPKRNLKKIKLTTLTFVGTYQVPVYIRDGQFSERFKTTTWYTYQKDTTDTYYKIYSANKKHSLIVNKSDLGSISDPNFKISLPNTDQFKDTNIVFMGDSITKGFNGQGTYSNGNYPTWVHKYLQANTKNAGHIRSSYTGSEFNSFSKTLPSVNLNNADALVLSYGTNDYMHSSASLTQIKNTIVNKVTTIKKNHPNLKVYGFLPINRYDTLRIQNAQRLNSYSFAQLKQTLKAAYRQAGVSYYDICEDHPELITQQNYRQTLFDKRLHPNCLTYQKMGYYDSIWLAKHL